MEINRPDVLAEVEAAFDRYEQALITNDVATLDLLFWNDPKTLRYGIAENLHGHNEIATFRAERPAKGLMRTQVRPQVTTFGTDYAVANTMFTRDGMNGKIGRQSQTWVRTDDGWRIVAAHVSVIDDA